MKNWILLGCEGAVWLAACWMATRFGMWIGFACGVVGAIVVATAMVASWIAAKCR